MHRYPIALIRRSVAIHLSFEDPPEFAKEAEVDTWNRLGQGGRMSSQGRERSDKLCSMICSGFPNAALPTVRLDNSRPVVLILLCQAARNVPVKSHS